MKWPHTSPLAAGAKEVVGRAVDRLLGAIGRPGVLGASGILEDEHVRRKALGMAVRTLYPADLGSTMRSGKRHAPIWTGVPELWGDLTRRPDLVRLAEASRRDALRAVHMLSWYEEESAKEPPPRIPLSLAIDEGAWLEELAYPREPWLGWACRRLASAKQPEWDPVRDWKATTITRSALEQALGEAMQEEELAVLVVPCLSLADAREIARWKGRTLSTERWCTLLEKWAAVLGDQLTVFVYGAEDSWRQATSGSLRSPTRWVVAGESTVPREQFESSMSHVLLSLAARRAVLEILWPQMAKFVEQLGTVHAVLRHRYRFTRDNRYPAMELPLRTLLAYAEGALRGAPRKAMKRCKGVLFEAREAGDVPFETLFWRCMDPVLELLHANQAEDPHLSELFLHRAELGQMMASALQAVAMHIKDINARDELARAREGVARDLRRARKDERNRPLWWIDELPGGNDSTLVTLTKQNPELKTALPILRATNLLHSLSKASPWSPGPSIHRRRRGRVTGNNRKEEREAENLLKKALSRFEETQARWGVHLIRVLLGIDFRAVQGRVPDLTFLGPLYAAIERDADKDARQALDEAVREATLHALLAHEPSPGDRWTIMPAKASVTPSRRAAP